MQNFFKRYEKKYLVRREQCVALQNIISRHMTFDCHGEYLVQNLYYDTDGWDAIRCSIEKPSYKEKIRLRCYGVMNQESRLFLELKKKYRGMVYKRRIAIPAKKLLGSSIRDVVSKDVSQISREIDFYMKANAVSEKMYISYNRTAFVGIADEGLRITFDRDVRARLDCLNYTLPGNGHTIIPQDAMLMEIKTLGGMPLWLTRVLSEKEIFPTPFSKCGVCYTNYVLKKSAIKGNSWKDGADQCLI